MLPKQRPRPSLAETCCCASCCTFFMCLQIGELHKRGCPFEVFVNPSKKGPQNVTSAVSIALLPNVRLCAKMSGTLLPYYWHICISEDLPTGGRVTVHEHETHERLSSTEQRGSSQNQRPSKYLLCVPLKTNKTVFQPCY